MSNFIISISYGNALIQNGGTDRVIREQKLLFKERDVETILLFPVVHQVPVLHRELRYWGMMAGDTFEGLYNAQGILGKLDSLLSAGDQCLAIFVHHLWRVDTTQLMQLLDAFDCPIYYYLHDFHAICNNNNLLSDGEFCGLGVTCAACNPSCADYHASMNNRATLKALLVRYPSRMTCIAPSASTCAIYQQQFPEFENRFRVIDHQIPDGHFRRNSTHGPLRVAYIGTQTHLKGWDDFRRLCGELSHLTAYQFYYMGSGQIQLPAVQNVYVSVREQGENAMLSALRTHGIDVVLLLSKCPETWSYTCFESWAAGCFTVTYACSGNIADAVRKYHHGIVVDGIESLITRMADTAAFHEQVRAWQAADESSPDHLLPNRAIVHAILSGEHAFQQRVPDTHSGRRYPLASGMYMLKNRRQLNEAKSSH